MLSSRASGSAAQLWPWAVAVLALAAGSGWIAATGMSGLGVLVMIVTAASIVIASRSRSIALGLLVVSVGLQVVLGAELNPAQVSAAATFYLVGRWGSRGEQRAALGVVALMGVLETVAAIVLGAELVEQLLYRSRVPAGAALLTVVTAAAAVLVVPLLIGAVQQARASAREGAAARERAEEELASTRVLVAVEAERARLARDVHDTVGHALTVVITQTRVLAAVASGDPAMVQQAAATVEQVAATALEDVRGVLAGAVRMADVTVDDLVELASSTERVHVLAEGPFPPLAGEVGEAAYRAVQELVTNALRHGASATPVTVSISRTEDRLGIEVRNSIAVDDAAASSTVDGSGLGGLRSRLDDARGALETATHDGSWIARATLPLDGAA